MMFLFLCLFLCVSLLHSPRLPFSPPHYTVSLSLSLVSASLCLSLWLVSYCSSAFLCSSYVSLFVSIFLPLPLILPLYVSCLRVLSVCLFYFSSFLIFFPLSYSPSLLSFLLLSVSLPLSPLSLTSLPDSKCLSKALSSLVEGLSSVDVMDF